MKSCNINSSWKRRWMPPSQKASHKPGHKASSIDPFSFVLLSSPIGCICISAAILVFDLSSNSVGLDTPLVALSRHWAAVLCQTLISTLLCLSAAWSISLVSPVIHSFAHLAKDVLILFCSYAVNNEPLTKPQVYGLASSIVGLIMFTYLRLRRHI